jgi:hypothetical protein
MDKIVTPQDIQDIKLRTAVDADLGDMSSIALADYTRVLNSPYEARAVYEASVPVLRIVKQKSFKGGSGGKPEVISQTRMAVEVKWAVWNIFCDVKKDSTKKGVPDPDWEKIFSDEGIGTKVIKAAIVAACAALGGLLGVGGVLAGSVLGAEVQDFVIKHVVIELLDVENRKMLKKYCECEPPDSSTK